jgi:hypothetical protein
MTRIGVAPVLLLAVCALHGGCRSGECCGHSDLLLSRSGSVRRRSAETTVRRCVMTVVETYAAAETTSKSRCPPLTSRKWRWSDRSLRISEEKSEESGTGQQGKFVFWVGFLKWRNKRITVVICSR